MTRLPVVTGKESADALLQAGVQFKRQKGSHIILVREDPAARVVVPNHRKGLKSGTLRQILRDADLSVDDFVDLL